MRTLFALVLVVSIVDVHDASAAIRDEADARLDISYSEDGAKTAGIVFRGDVTDPEAVRLGVAEWFGTDPDRVEVIDNFEEYPLLLLTRGRLDRSNPLLYSDSLNWDTLRAALDASGVYSLQVVGFAPPSPGVTFGDFVGANLLGVQRYEEVVPVSQLRGMAFVRYGWGYGHLAAHILTPLAFLLLFELGLRHARRRALAAEGVERAPAVFRCAKTHHFASLSFLVLWPGLILMLVPMGYLLYIPKPLYPAALVFRILLPLLVAFPYLVWMRLALYPVCQHFPEPNWSRRDLAVQGCAIGLLSVLYLPLSCLSIVMLLDKPEWTNNCMLISTAVALVSVVCATLLYSKAVRLVVHTPESGPVRDRLDALAQWLSVEDAPVLKVLHYPKTSLARSVDAIISFNAIRAHAHKAIPLAARSMRALLPDELDAVLVSKLDRLSHPRIGLTTISLTKALVLLQICLIFVAIASISLGDDVKYYWSGWIVFTIVYLMPALLFLGMQLIESRTARRFTCDSDDRVLKRVGDPEVQIRAILREARANHESPETPRWLRCVSSPSPMDRVRHLAARGGITAERIASLRAEIDANLMSGLDTDELDGIGCLDQAQICLNLLRPIPILVLLAFIVAFSWADDAFLARLVPPWIALPVVVVSLVIALAMLQSWIWRCGTRRCYEALCRNVRIPEGSDGAPVPVVMRRVRNPAGARGGGVVGVGFLFTHDDVLYFRSDTNDLDLNQGVVSEISVHLDSAGFYPFLQLQLSLRKSGDWTQYTVQLLRPGAAHDANLGILTLHRQLWRWWRQTRVRSLAQSDGEGAIQFAPSRHWKPTINTKSAVLDALGAATLFAASAFYLGWQEEMPLDWSASNSALFGPMMFLGVFGLSTLCQQVYAWWIVRRFSGIEGAAHE